MTDSINRYYRYRPFDYLIKIKLSFQCFNDFYTFYHSFLEEVGHFFDVMAKNGENLANFLNCSFDRLTDNINSVCTDESMAIRQRRLLWSIVDTIDQKKKSLTNGLITSIKMRPKVSIALVSIYRRLCPSMPLAPSPGGEGAHSIAQNQCHFWATLLNILVGWHSLNLSREKEGLNFF